MPSLTLKRIYNLGQTREPGAPLQFSADGDTPVSAFKNKKR